MLQRLYSSLQKGPSLNARPHNSRQRIDASQLTFFHSGSVDALLPSLLGKNRKFSFVAAVPSFRAPDGPEEEWSDEQKKHRSDYEQQTKLMSKLQEIAVDSQEYYNDHGENALFIGYPIVSIPSEEDESRFKKSRILAPLAFIPVSLIVKKGRKPGVTISSSGEGSDLLIPNPALLAWFEQQTGEEIPDLFDDDTGEDPARELNEILDFVTKALAIKTTQAISHDVVLKPIQRADQLPDHPVLMQSAVLGLFPITNPGLLRDTKWMIQHEDELRGPVQSFLCQEALQANSDVTEIPEDEFDETTQASAPSTFANDYFIAPIDPSQARTAINARSSKVLVIHGPPGTGKSQTISNIIGDLLARGQRVLFVCDKRTALDVVKYRLDHVGIGHLCGVIHDPSRDRRSFYMGLRDRLEELSSSEHVANPERSLKRVNEGLEKLDTELKRYFNLLHGKTHDDESFHELVGKWFEYKRSCLGRVSLPDLSGISLQLVESKKIDLSEIFRRADSARLVENPLFEQLSLDLESFVSLGNAEIRTRFERNEKNAEKVDECFTPDLIELGAMRSLPEQAEVRESLAGILRKLESDGDKSIVARIVSMDSSSTATIAGEWKMLSEHVKKIHIGLERDLVLQTGGALPNLSQINQDLLAIQDWKSEKGGLFSFLKFGKKKSASETLKRYAATLNDANLTKVENFCSGVKARWLVGDTVGRLLGEPIASLVQDDERLRLAAKTLTLFSDIWSCLDIENEDEYLYRCIQSTLSMNADRISQFSESLELSAKRARLIDQLLKSLEGDKLLNRVALTTFDSELRANGRALPRSEEWSRHSNTIEDVIRIEEALKSMDEDLGKAVKILAVANCDQEESMNELYAAAYRNTIREAIGNTPELLNIDTARINASFDEYGKLLEEKQKLIKRHINYSWEKKQRERLISSSGSRLSFEGTALRQRLFIRGKKALRLRQMIAAGEAYEDGDPLFDLCPVWMASPSTVAQILPRDKIFDTVVFDEASQCRLEEALPILLRANRVVIAGDPKQLPPTRFFESAFVESDNADVDTLEEIAEQQMTEAEDLLSAALNLDADESFLEVHYRSKHESLIGFSNKSFYGSRLQAIPSHPKNNSKHAPLSVIQVDGVYQSRSNREEAIAIVDLVAELLAEKSPPSIGIASFNINQRDLIIAELDERAASDSAFSKRLSLARQKRGDDSFEGLFVRNLENVQGDERDHIIISTTFGRDKEGRFRRNFGAVSRTGGDKRLNVLVTRSRSAIHVFTSIPKEEYMSIGNSKSSSQLSGREQLYAYLKYASDTQKDFESAIDVRLSEGTEAQSIVNENAYPSRLAEGVGASLRDSNGIGSIVHWGNEGFCVDTALVDSKSSGDVTVGVLIDFNRFRKTQDPIAWEHFRTNILKFKGWDIYRVWSPYLSREPEDVFQRLLEEHENKLSD